MSYSVSNRAGVHCPNVMPLPVSVPALQRTQVVGHRTDNLSEQAAALGHDRIQSDGLVSGA